MYIYIYIDREIDGIWWNSHWTNETWCQLFIRSWGKKHSTCCDPRGGQRSIFFALAESRCYWKIQQPQRTRPPEVHQIDEISGWTAGRSQACGWRGGSWTRHFGDRDANVWASYVVGRSSGGLWNEKQAAFANPVYKHRFQCLGVLFEVWRRESFCLPAVAKEGDCGGPGEEGSLHWEGKTRIYWLRLSTCTGEQVVRSNWIMSCVHMKQSGAQDSFWH